MNDAQQLLYAIKTAHSLKRYMKFQTPLLKRKDCYIDVRSNLGM